MFDTTLCSEICFKELLLYIYVLDASQGAATNFGTSSLQILSLSCIPTYHFWRLKKLESNTSTDWIQTNHHPNAKKHCKQFVELARCERVMTTRAEFHFSWVYTFSATPRSLRICATHPPRETGCDPAPPAQLCWSSSSSFPHICTTTSWNWTVTKLI